jgi:DNA-nicking Smr family endonuclease
LTAQNGSDDDESKTFADLIGETRPLKDAKEVLAPRKSQTGKGKRASQPTTHADPSQTKATSRFRRPDPTEPRLAAADGVNDQRLFDLKRGIPEPQERIDLHGLRTDAAPRILAQRLESAMARDLRCVLVIHGKGTGGEKGEAILRDRLPEWLSRTPNGERVLAFAPAPSKLGGDGATLVLLASQ